MSKKNPIDLYRDSAMSTRVGTDDEGAINEMMSLGEVMYIIKDRAIYSMQLADQIDPGRTNISIPKSVQQKWAPLGTESELVGRIFLTARELFKPTYLDKSVDCDRSIAISMTILKEMIALDEIFEKFSQTQSQQLQQMPVGQKDFHLPSIPGTEGYVKAFILKAEHAVQMVYNLCHLFFDGELKERRRFLDGLSDLVQAKYGDKDDFTKFIATSTKFLKFIRNSRHCIEHERVDQRVNVNDFTLKPSGEISLPAMEIIHDETPQPPIAVADFMKQVFDGLVDVTENLIAFLCSKHVRQSGPPTEVSFIPPNERRYPAVQYGYVILLGGNWIRAS